MLFRSKHYEVFKAIKMARRRKYADDEVLFVPDQHLGSVVEEQLGRAR